MANLSDGDAVADDAARVQALLGRPPRGAFTVVVRDESGDPVVIRNAPVLDDGTPMPTRYWLIGSTAVTAVSRLEADGGVRAAEAAVDAEELSAAHARYAAERDADIPADAEYRPSGGVGGTRQGVKCLHAHYAWHLAGGDDPVGRWVAERLGPTRLDVAIADDRVVVALGTVEATLAVTPRSLLHHELALLDLDDDTVPPPASLTNALGAVSDAYDDLVLVHPELDGSRRLSCSGVAAWDVVAVEQGRRDLPPVVDVGRADIEDLFRTIATESRVDRRHNPGLAPGNVDAVLAATCVIVGIVRRCSVSSVEFRMPPALTGLS